MSVTTRSTPVSATDLRTRAQGVLGRLVSAQDWDAFMAYARNHRRYSLMNNLLLWDQAPHATKVAGYIAWQDNGRQVRAGEKSLKLLASRPVTTVVDGRVQASIEHSVVSVFEHSQTEAMDDFGPLPERKTERIKNLKASVRAIVAEHGWRIHLQVTHKHRPRPGHLFVDRALGPDQQFRGFILESTNALINLERGNPYDPETARLAAIWSANLVFAHLGMEPEPTEPAPGHRVAKAYDVGTAVFAAARELVEGIEARRQ